jgi:hypothetical protein
MNIMDVVRSTLGGGTTMSAISSQLGLSQDQTQRATSATIPTLLAGLTHVASTPHGAEQLSDAISRQDPGMVDNISNTLSSQGGQMAEHGQGILSSLMGSGAGTMLGSTLSRFTGVGEGATGKLIGLCAPLVLGVLGKQQRSMGLGASGLGNFLTGQKDNIRAAMPAGLDSMLSNVPGFSQFFAARPTAATTATTTATTTAEADYARPRAETTRQIHEPAMTKSSASKWAIPLLLAIAVLGGLMYVNRHRHEEGVGGTGSERTVVRGRDTSFVSDSSRLVRQATSVLSGVKDTATAQAAVPKLKTINDGLTRLRSDSSQPPGATRSTAQDALKPALEKYQATAQQALNVPGAGDILRPHVDQLTSNINSLIP